MGSLILGSEGFRMKRKKSGAPLPLPQGGCKCKNSKCLKLYCECLQRQAYCKGCSCKNCHNNPAHEEKRQQAIVRITERNPDAFNKPVAGGTQRKCHCKRSQCLKKYCECFQAGLACLPECSCVSCKNFEGSDLRARAQNGEDVHIRPSTHDMMGDDDDDAMGAPRVRPARRAAARRKIAREEFPSSDDALVAEALSNSSSKRARPLAANLKPNALPIKLPAGSTRSLRNQFVRLDLCSFINSSVGPFSHMLLLGTQENKQSYNPRVKADPQAALAEPGDDGMDLRTQEQMPETSLESVQEKFVLEETAAFLKKVLAAANGSIESQRILLF